MLTDGTMPEYLYRRTNGVVGLLERLIEDGCREAVDTGTERLDQALLDSVALGLPDIHDRDAGAGEIPPSRPRHPAQAAAGPGSASAGGTPSSMTAVRRPAPDHDPGRRQPAASAGAAAPQPGPAAG